MLGLLASLTIALPDGLPDQAALKAAFNRAKGKVRLVMLVSPT